MAQGLSKISPAWLPHKIIHASQTHFQVQPSLPGARNETLKSFYEGPGEKQFASAALFRHAIHHDLLTRQYSYPPSHSYSSKESYSLLRARQLHRHG
jgi:hypothetical protein